MNSTQRLSEVIDLGDPVIEVVADALANHVEELEYRADCDDHDARQLGLTDGCPEAHKLRREAQIARELLRDLGGRADPRRTSSSI